MSGPLNLVQREQSPEIILPFGFGDSGAQMETVVIVGRKLDGSFDLIQRLPSGVAFDPNNPAHIFGLFVVQNAQQLLSMAMQAARELERQRKEQTNETTAAKSLPGA